ncbi:MAG TPA: sugar phosphate isomerase/epimerase [Pseudonocardiaceae bacterium]|nr:sugar phosphate isomerase/epimerase [Pseudonocardiaceae bacterium]
MDRLSLNQATVKSLTLPEAIDACVRAGVGSIGVWRDRLAEIGVAQAKKLLDDAGLRVSSLCRGGFFTAGDAHADNVAALEEAAGIGTDVLILVSGGLPDGSRDLAGARERVADGIAALVPTARELGVRLGIEALHPMFCADRCVVSSLGQALDIAERFPADTVGVVIDTYHLWWDHSVVEGIARAGGRIVSYQVSDWRVPLPTDMLLGRAHVGDGSIDFRPMTEAVEAAGYTGDVEVEIFNEDVWATPADATIATVRERFVSKVVTAAAG